MIKVENLNIKDNESLDNESLELRVKNLELELKALKDKELIRLGSDFETFMIWCRKRETIEPQDNNFFIFEECFNKAKALIEPLKFYIENSIYNNVLFSAGMHYIITEPYNFLSINDENVINPLYLSYNIQNKSYLVSSVSDEGSSSTIHITKSLTNGDFIMQDLLRTRYGMWVYSILEQLDISAVLL